MEGRQLAEWKAAIRKAVGAADGGNHQPVRTTHDHYHIHGADSGVQGLDASGGHAHLHSHGKAPSTQHPPKSDNDHLGHAHDDGGYPGDDPDNPDYSRPDGLPGTTGSLRPEQAIQAIHAIRAAFTGLRPVKGGWDEAVTGIEQAAAEHERHHAERVRRWEADAPIRRQAEIAMAEAHRRRGVKDGGPVPILARWAQRPGSNGIF
jgi:hypothetical protein